MQTPPPISMPPAPPVADAGRERGDARRRTVALAVGGFADRLAGCVFCDAANRVPSSAAAANCWRCGSALPEDARTASTEAATRLSGALALLIATWVCIVVAHSLPMVSLELHGQASRVTLSGASVELWHQQRHALSAALFVTTVLAPIVELAAMNVAVLALRRRVAQHRTAPRWLAAALHLWQGMREWNFTEVMVLGTAVALVKLGQLATLIVGPGLVALLAFMALRLAALRLFSPGHAWSMLEPRGA